MNIKLVLCRVGMCFKANVAGRWGNNDYSQRTGCAQDIGIKL